MLRQSWRDGAASSLSDFTLRVHFTQPPVNAAPSRTRTYHSPSPAAGARARPLPTRVPTDQRCKRLATTIGSGPAAMA